MNELTDAEREALQRVSVGATHIRALARLLPDSPEARKIEAIADGKHNVPAILAGSADERRANEDRMKGDVAALITALGIKAPNARLTAATTTLYLVKKETGAATRE